MDGPRVPASVGMAMADRIGTRTRFMISSQLAATLDGWT